MGTAETSKSHKDQGNEFFKSELWLKAAACYTKGIKDTSDDAVLYRHVSVADQACTVPVPACNTLVVLMQQSLCSVAQAAEGRQSSNRCRYMYTA